MSHVPKRLGYEKYIKSGAWKRMRILFHAWVEDSGIPAGCWACGIVETESVFHVHHRFYPDTLGHEPVNSLSKLCEKCHSELHKLHNQGRKKMSLWEFSNLFITYKRISKELGAMPSECFEFLPVVEQPDPATKGKQKCRSLTKNQTPCKNLEVKHGLCNSHRPTRVKPNQQPIIPAGENRWVN